MTTYTGWLKVTTDENDEVVDIQTMQRMGNAEYIDYARDHLLFMDHHDVLRSNLGQYSVATTAAQVDALIQVLEEYKQRML